MVKARSRGRESPCNATALSRRHAIWGAYWVQHGCAAVLVDSFGPRGRAHGHGRHTHDAADRFAVDERTVQPLDAEAALAWLAARPDVQANRETLQGWSNGALPQSPARARLEVNPAHHLGHRHRFG